MFTKQFWKAVAERAIKTFAQAGAALLIGHEAGLVGLDWVNFFSISGAAALLSVLTSIVFSGGDSAGPSMTGAETLVYTPYTPEGR